MTHEIQAQQTGMQGFSLLRKTLRVDNPAELSDLSLYVTFFFCLVEIAMRIYSSLFWFKVEEISWQNRTNLISSHHWVISVFFSFQVYFALKKQKKNGFFMCGNFGRYSEDLQLPLLTLSL